MLSVVFTLLLKPMGSRKRSLNLVGPGQGQRPPVFLFYTIYLVFKIKHNTYKFLWYENPKIIWIEPTLVLTRVCPTWATSCRHPNHSSRAITSYTASVEWNKIFPYATSIISRPYEPVVLRNITMKQNPCPKVWSCKHMYIYIKYSQQMASSLNLSNYKSCT